MTHLFQWPWLLGAVLLTTIVLSTVQAQSANLAEQAVLPNGLVSLDPSTFKQFLLRPTLVLFTASGCARCEQTIDEFSKANTLLQAEQDGQFHQTGTHTGKETRFALVNCTERELESICHEYQIEAFPTILAVQYPNQYHEYGAGNKGDQPHDQHAARVASAIYRFFKSTFHRELFPSLTTTAQYKQFTTTGLGPGYLKSVLRIPPQAWLPGDRFQPYRMIRQALLDKLIVMAHDLEPNGAFALYNTTTHLGLGLIETEEQLSAAGGTWQGVDDSFYFEIHRNFDALPDGAPFVHEIRSSADVLAINQIWESKLVPLWDTITAGNYNNYLKRQLPMVWVFYQRNSPAVPLTKSVEAIFPQIAAKFNDDLVFVGVDSVRFGQHALSFGVKAPSPGAAAAATEPLFGIVIEDRFQRKNYVYEPATKSAPLTLNREHIEAWLRDFITANPRAVATLRSEPEPDVEPQPTISADGTPIPPIRNAIQRVVGTTLKPFLATFVNAQPDSNSRGLKQGHNGSPVHRSDVLLLVYAQWCTATPHLREILYDIMTDGSGLTEDQVDVVKTTNKLQSTPPSSSADVESPTWPTNPRLGPHVVFAQLDVALNDLPHDGQASGWSIPAVTETPTLLLFPAATGAAAADSSDDSTRPSPIKFDGKFETPEIWAWLVQHATTPQNLNSGSASTTKNKAIGRHDEL